MEEWGLTARPPNDNFTGDDVGEPDKIRVGIPLGISEQADVIHFDGPGQLSEREENGAD